jgi:hypothetical protein
MFVNLIKITSITCSPFLKCWRMRDLKKQYGLMGHMQVTLHHEYLKI